MTKRIRAVAGQLSKLISIIDKIYGDNEYGYARHRVNAPLIQDEKNPANRLLLLRDSAERIRCKFTNDKPDIKYRFGIGAPMIFPPKNKTIFNTPFYGSHVSKPHYDQLLMLKKIINTYGFRKAFDLPAKLKEAWLSNECKALHDNALTKDQDRKVSSLESTLKTLINSTCNLSYETNDYEPPLRFGEQPIQLLPDGGYNIREKVNIKHTHFKQECQVILDRITPKQVILDRITPREKLPTRSPDTVKIRYLSIITRLYEEGTGKAATLPRNDQLMSNGEQATTQFYDFVRDVRQLIGVNCSGRGALLKQLAKAKDI